MQNNIIDGRVVAAKIKSELKIKVDQAVSQGLTRPCLAVIQVGLDPASTVYVSHKKRACEEIGITSRAFELTEETTTATLLKLIEELNQDKQVHGILVQLPLPEHLDEKDILEHIAPHKDVDGFHPFNIGRLVQRRPLLRPCTPFGVMRLLEHYQHEVKGQHAVVIGASNIVGRPMAFEFLMAGATTTVCHRFTKDLAYFVRQADILVVACGKPGLIPGEWIKPGSVVIDVGINRLPTGQLVGDVEFETAQAKAKLITPVPGGVGPMTVAMLMENTYQAAIGQQEN